MHNKIWISTTHQYGERENRYFALRTNFVRKRQSLRGLQSIICRKRYRGRLALKSPSLHCYLCYGKPTAASRYIYCAGPISFGSLGIAHNPTVSLTGLHVILATNARFPEQRRFAHPRHRFPPRSPCLDSHTIADELGTNACLATTSLVVSHLQISRLYAEHDLCKPGKNANIL